MKESKQRARQRKRNLLLMAVIGYKHVFKKLIQLIKYEAKGIVLQMQYKMAKYSYERELKKIEKGSNEER